jgi:hypothetical protein
MKKTCRRCVFVCLLLGLNFVYSSSAFAEAQENPQQQQQKQQMSPEQMSAYMKGMMKSMLDVYSSPETAQGLARFYKALYDALIKEGFTKQEALQIVLAQGSLIKSGK